MMKWECLKNNKYNRFVIVDIETQDIFDDFEIFHYDYDKENNEFASFFCMGGVKPNLKNLKFARIFLDEIEILKLD